MKSKKNVFGKIFSTAMITLLMLSLSQYTKAQDSDSISIPKFSKAHGLYSKSFVLRITPSVAGREIRYTVDCSEPTAESKRYNTGVLISKSTVIRAAEVISDDSLSAIATATYIFPDDVLTQAVDANGSPTIPDGYPDKWGKFDTMSGTAPAYYSMDSYIVNKAPTETKKGLSQLPIISVVTDKDNLFSHEIDEEKGGIYIYTGSPMGDGTGRDWERKVSMEMIGGNLKHDLTVDCGLKLHGGHSRLPEKNPKHAFKLRFKSKYGPSKLRYAVFGDEGVDVFEDLVLRTYFGNAWQHWDEGNRQKAQYTRDLWARSVQERLGYPCSKGQAVHLFLNGMYWGIYNLCERITAEHCAAHYGGKKKDYDVIKVEETLGEQITASDGTLDAWNEMSDMIQEVNKWDDDALNRLEGKDSDGNRDESLAPMLDIDAFIDYMLINFYGGNTDWDHHNWYAFRSNKDPEHGFRFMCWDTELIFGNVNENVTGKKNSGKPTYFLNCLMRNETFRNRFNHRAHVLLTDDGLLTSTRAVEVWDSLYHNIDYALYDESARWGAYRRDIHQYTAKGHRYLMSSYFMNERTRLIDNYFPQRTDIVLNQLESKGWFSTTDHIASTPSTHTTLLIYDLTGRPRGTINPDGTLPSSLPQGIYLINGRKISKR